MKSHQITKGDARAPARAMLKAMGLTNEEMDQVQQGEEVLTKRRGEARIGAAKNADAEEVLADAEEVLADARKAQAQTLLSWRINFCDGVRLSRMAALTPVSELWSGIQFPRKTGSTACSAPGHWILV